MLPYSDHLPLFCKLLFCIPFEFAIKCDGQRSVHQQIVSQLLALTAARHNTYSSKLTSNFKKSFILQDKCHKPHHQIAIFYS